MRILSVNIKSSYTIKKSKFICLGYFVNSKDDVKKIVSQCKKEYSDASHICYAYILDDNNYYFIDGGEPSGTAGKPIYGSLQTYKLNYILFIVVRYFGGIKFGPGPLRQTFKNVVLDTLKTAKIKKSEVLDVIQILIPLSLTKQIDSIFNDAIIHRSYNDGYVTISIKGQCNRLLPILNNLKIKPIVIKHKQIL